MSLVWREARGTVALAVPLVAGQVSHMLMGVADTIMIGHLGVVPLAAGTLAMTLMHVPLVFSIGLLVSVSIRVSQARGAGNVHGGRTAVRNGLYLAFALGAIALAAGFLAKPVLGVLGQDPAVAGAAETYFVIVMASLVPGLACMVFKNFADAMNRPWGAFWILLGGVGVNVVLNWTLIYGNLGAPALGLEGAGWATLIARGLSVAVLFGWVARWGHFGEWVPVRWLRVPSWETMRSLLRVGLPTSVQLLAEVGAFVAATVMIGWLSAEALAAHQVAITCAATTFMVPLGVSMALTVRVGEAWGAGEVERLRPIVAGGLWMGAGVMAFSALVFVSFGRTIAGWFIPDAAVIVIAAKLLVVAGIFQISDGIQITAAGCLRGMDDVRIPAWIALGAYWVVALPLGAGLAFGLDLGAVGVWLGLTTGLLIAAVLLGGRIWRKTRG
ncbi:MAG: MATE family efflux transporter [Chthoniobacterales bacterium]